MDDVYIGVLSGTSVDAIDAIAVSFEQKRINIIEWHTESLPHEIKQSVIELQNHSTDIAQLSKLDVQFGNRFAFAANQLLNKASLSADRISGIGLHGQTILHQPSVNPAFTLQVGDPNIVAVKTHCTTVADFRRADMAAGGQGAPLACAFHAEFLSVPDKNRAIVNVGGICSITILMPNKPTIGFDCGPGNTLMDNWAQRHIRQRYDRNGAWAASASKYNEMLLAEFLKDEFIQRIPPKSTCTSHFNSAWLDGKLAQNQCYAKLEPAIVQATLAELTATCIAQIVQTYVKNTPEVFVCGGGANNDHLMRRIKANINVRTECAQVEKIDALNIHPDWVEALVFAWLAKQRLSNKPMHIPEVTGADKKVALGAIYQPVR